MTNALRILGAVSALALCMQAFGVEAAEEAQSEEFRVAPVEAAKAVAVQAPAKTGEDVKIAFSPKGKMQEEARKDFIGNEVFRKTVEGDEAAAAKWQKLPAEARVATLARAAENAHRPLRKRALEELAALSEGDLESPESKKLQRQALAKASVHECVDDMRDNAMKAWLGAAKRDGRKAVEEMGNALDLDNPMEQGRALKNLQAVGGNDVVEVLITKIEMRWGKFPRSHMVVATQRSYIADYDVSGSAYDPVVRSMLTGVVLDVQILEVMITKYIIEELRRLGADDAALHGPQQWKAFLKKKAEADNK
jgi:hypothetical protein